MLDNLKQRVFGGAQALGMWTITYKPQILGAASDILNIGSCVTSAIGTHMAEKRVRKAKADIEDFERDLESGLISESEAKKKVWTIIAKTSAAVLGCYAPTVVAMTGSIICHNKQVSILAQRQAELLAAYATLEMAYNDLRRKWGEAHGEEDLMVHEEGLVEKEAYGEKDAKYVATLTPEEAAEKFIFYFDRNETDAWEYAIDINHMFIEAQFAYLNSCHFNVDGFVRPSEFMHVELGFKRTYKDLDNYCWVADKNDPFGSIPAYEEKIVDRVDEDGSTHQAIMIKLLNLKPIAEAIAKGYLID